MPCLRNNCRSDKIECTDVFYIIVSMIELNSEVAKVWPPPLSLCEALPTLLISDESEEYRGIIQKHLQDERISAQDFCFPSNESLAPLSSSCWRFLLEDFVSFL
jgi:hypothetical protein